MKRFAFALVVFLSVASLNYAADPPKSNSKEGVATLASSPDKTPGESFGQWLRHLVDPAHNQFTNTH